MNKIKTPSRSGSTTNSNSIKNPRSNHLLVNYCIISLNFLSKSLNVIRSIFIRIVFGVHALIAIFVVCYVKDDLWYLVNFIGISFLFIECFVTSVLHNGKDLNWFSPSFFIYISTLIPPTWFLELESIRIKTAFIAASNRQNFTSGSSGGFTTRRFYTKRDVNFTLSTTTPTAIQDQYDSNEIIEDLVPLVPEELKAALSATVDQFAIYIEVSMMLIIILGRWMMPKKGITRSELSQLLLVYMSIASDVIDLLSVLQEQPIILNKSMVYATLSIYSWSLYQFTLNLVAKSKNTTSRSSLSSLYSFKEATDGAENNNNHETRSLNGQTTAGQRSNADNQMLKNEISNILINLLMQDIPFFILRIICVVKFNVFTYSSLFFTFKNGILFVLQVYRLIAILSEGEYFSKAGSGSSKKRESKSREFDNRFVTAVV